eukprot:COSAG06_NODE_2056_length_7720_cov_5.135678_1_plen_172_part_00
MRREQPTTRRAARPQPRRPLPSPRVTSGRLCAQQALKLPPVCRENYAAAASRLLHACCAGADCSVCAQRAWLRRCGEGPAGGGLGERARTAGRFWWPPSRRNEAGQEHGALSGAPANTRTRQLIAAARAIVTLRPRPDEGWNRAEPSSPCHSRCRLFFATERWRRSFLRRK